MVKGVKTHPQYQYALVGGTEFNYAAYLNRADLRRACGR